ncbi:transmembrane protein, putative (macronuclear) [Tetrahymena thermophila SB210]|uniref:Transmembrane protein, putative n=1 Tax=Tetrahymena thermophila (strain SB210) TaxID=312017 RepID=W7X381_TETTS|nr:transmembrane protein, putative [Tetrahymena thermophila SB210]EWS71897.1 transmembrane protein, putative [Tetrahymena thermophila SB210]|eukprot:XP_012655575.1 transmembrane protein, putative [Tetrahymena thermophila SB210]
MQQEGPTLESTFQAIGILITLLSINYTVTSKAIAIFISTNAKKIEENIYVIAQDSFRYLTRLELSNYFKLQQQKIKQMNSKTIVAATHKNTQSSKSVNTTKNDTPKPNRAILNLRFFLYVQRDLIILLIYFISGKFMCLQESD